MLPFESVLQHFPKGIRKLLHHKKDSLRGLRVGRFSQYLVGHLLHIDSPFHTGKELFPYQSMCRRRSHAALPARYGISCTCLRFLVSSLRSLTPAEGSFHLPPEGCAHIDLPYSLIRDLRKHFDSFHRKKTFPVSCPAFFPEKDEMLYLRI